MAHIFNNVIVQFSQRVCYICFITGLCDYNGSDWPDAGHVASPGVSSVTAVCGS